MGRVRPHKSVGWWAGGFSNRIRPAVFARARIDPYTQTGRSRVTGAGTRRAAAKKAAHAPDLTATPPRRHHQIVDATGRDCRRRMLGRGTRARTHRSAVGKTRAPACAFLSWPSAPIPGWPISRRGSASRMCAADTSHGLNLMGNDEWFGLDSRLQKLDRRAAKKG